MNAALNALPAQARAETPKRTQAAPRVPCTVTALPGVSLSRAAWLACMENALTEDEYGETLAGTDVTERVPPLPGEGLRAYAARAASAVMVAYVFGWEAVRA